jgi:hypothetical protein
MKAKNQNLGILRILYKLLLLPLFLPTFLLDLILFLTINEGCIDCGLKEIIKKGIFLKILIKKLK